MKTALGSAGLEGFPYQLSPLKTKTALPIPVATAVKLCARDVRHFK